MPTTVIADERIQILHDCPTPAGDYVLYWMQESQRAEHNDALEFAIQQANAQALPLLVCFGLLDDYPEANLRHYTFMLEGLRATAAALAQRGIKLVLRRGAPTTVALTLGRRATTIVCDRSYLRHQRLWRQQVAAAATCPVFQVEANAIVPVEVASNKREYAARTIRPKLHRVLDRFLVALLPTPLEHPSLDLALEGEALTDLATLLGKLKIDRSVGAVSQLFPGGFPAAKRILDQFLAEQFAHYQEDRNQPQTNTVSHMSKYLHFGQISPVYLAQRIRNAAHVAATQIDAYIEELAIRRELAINFVYYTPDYDQYRALPAWAQQTLAEHRADTRAHRYTRQQLADSETHDPYWNAAMQELRVSGYMHNYMRMYWGKKILEWSTTPEAAYETTLALNNQYFLDGRDANSFTGVGWIFGLHDRPWQERSIFGKVRYMAASGLERKADMAGYIAKVQALAARP
jgi:deoxyribodipyrimidine photo-lyase